MTGQGGWPLSVFLTPDLKPFYGGTYFPPTPRYGMPSFKQFLEFIANCGRKSGDDVGAQRGADCRGGEGRLQREPGGSLSRAILDGGYAALVSAFDAEHGGFGGAPKFPLPNYLSFLMRYFSGLGRSLPCKSVTKTLEAMRLRRHSRPSGRGVPQVLHGQILAGAPLREDALRQRAPRSSLL